MGVSKMTVPTQLDFQNELDNLFMKAREDGKEFIEVTSKQVHSNVGGYPSNNHRMPVCCDVMLAKMQSSDEIIEQPPKGKGATLKVKYYL